MDNLDFNNPLNQLRPLDNNPDKPIPFDDSDTSDKNDKGVSHSPLDLGGTDPVQIPKAEPAKTAKPEAAKKPTLQTAPTDRITGVRTFFTKLHPGAMNFLDEQITRWLTENPDIHVKRTNVVTGSVQAKKTEPNIIITIWY